MAAWNRMAPVERRRICQAPDDFLKVSLIGFPNGLNVEFQRKREIRTFILSNWNGIAFETGGNSVEQIKSSALEMLHLRCQNPSENVK